MYQILCNILLITGCIVLLLCIIALAIGVIILIIYLMTVILDSIDDLIDIIKKFSTRVKKNDW